MMVRANIFNVVAAITALSLPLAHAQGCSTTVNPVNGIKPSIASAFNYAVVATGLTEPRGLEFDSKGNLLIVESGLGVTLNAIGSSGTGATCALFSSRKTLIADSGVSLFHEHSNASNNIC